MSFLDKIAGKTRDALARGGSSTTSLGDAPPTANPMERTVRLGSSDPDTEAPRSGRDSSIISEAAPSELAADFSETRIQPEPDEAAPTGLPLIGAWSAARQQRFLLPAIVEQQHLSH